MEPIPFNKPFIIGNELSNIQEAVDHGKLSGDGAFTYKCSTWLEDNIDCRKAMLVHSCTAALEMAALLCELKVGDEVILPSYTFVSTANAVALRGAKPVFVDIDPQTLCMDSSLLEPLITNRTKAIIPVHYGGVACDMDRIMDIANCHGLWVIEDAAQALGATYKGRPLGSIGHLGCFSFHETKNIISGEGGALVVNDERFVERAEIIREKGTNRARFFRGEVDKYSWVDIGSSYLASELVAAFLYGQLEHAAAINARRLEHWRRYRGGLIELAESGTIVIANEWCPESSHNAHLFYLLSKTLAERTELLDFLKTAGVHAVFHYVPLHQSLFAQRFGYTRACPVTENVADRLIRLPMYYQLSDTDQDRVIALIKRFYHDVNR